jgi:hypothetical protein
MFIKRFIAVASIFAVSAILLFVYPSTDHSITAGQSTNTWDFAALKNVHSITASSNDVLVHYFGKDVEKTMKQPGCVGVRMYYGKRADGKTGFVIVGVDKYGKDLVPAVIAGPGLPCPPICNG